MQKSQLFFHSLKHEDKWHMQPAIYIHLSGKWQLHATCKASRFETRTLHACPACCTNAAKYIPYFCSLFHALYSMIHI